jgi:hypothetical protein
MLSRVPAAALAAGAAKGNFGAGAVLQVVHFDYAGQQAFTVPANIETSLATALAATITPTSATSKILVMCSANLNHNYSTPSVVRAFLQRTGPSTANNTLAQSGSMTNFSHVVYTVGTDFMWPNTAMNWLDAPGSTSPCTYTLRIGGNTAGSVVGLNKAINYGTAWGSVSHLTLLEIAG